MKPLRCRVFPEPNDQVRFELNGRECLRWHHGSSAPRPFFFPLVGPAGYPLTRMGHPGAPDHDHHRSLWFAHSKVLGVDFWSDRTPARIRQRRWLAYLDGDNEAVMAVELGWYDGHEPRPLLIQELIVAVRPQPDDEWQLELQSRFIPSSETLEFQKTNYGFLAVRVAATISEHFGEGVLTNNSGRLKERGIFGQPAAWVDYSGPIGERISTGKEMPVDGITYFDHPTNVGFPNRWHVREDGWMCALPCFSGPLQTSKKKPLQLRYLLHLHRGAVAAEKAAEAARQFARRGEFRVSKSTARHQAFAVARRDA